MPPTSSGMPPSEVTASTIISASCSRAIAATSRDRDSARPSMFPRARSSRCRRRDALQRAARRCPDRSRGPTRASTRVTVAAVPRRHLREPIAEVAGHDRRARAARLRRDSRPRFPWPTCRCPRPRTRTTVFGARNTRASRARTSSMIATNCGSRWLEHRRRQRAHHARRHQARARDRAECVRYRAACSSP